MRDDLMPQRPSWRAAGPLLLALAFACGCQPQAPVEQAPAAPTVEELRQASYSGLDLDEPTITLVNGVWEGKPFVAGSESRPSVRLVRDFRLVGDLDGDGFEEAATLLAENSGGSGDYLYLAVVDRAAGSVRNIATAPIGDRVQVRQAGLSEGRIVLDLVQPGPEDAACCPGALVERTWRLSDGNLEELPARDQGRLGLDTIADADWVLRAWDLDEPAPHGIEVSLAFPDGQVTGQSGCNRYSAPVSEGEMPGDIEVGETVTTRMACPDSVMAVETRFLSQLRDVRKFGFVVGQLALSYESDGEWRTMLFDRRLLTPAS